MELQPLQRKFSAILLGKTQEQEASATVWISGNNRLPAQLQLQIYNTSSLENIVKALLSIFPTCVSLVGEDFMRQLLRYYVRANLCAEPSFLVYAENIPNFICEYKNANVTPYLSDVAKLDLAWDKAYFGSQPQTYTLQSWQEQLLEHGAELTVSLHASATLITSKYPLLQIWRACQSNKDEHSEITLGKYYFAVWPCGGEIAIAEIAAEKFALLSSFKTSLSISDLCRMHDKMPAEKIVTILNYAVAQGMLI